MNILLINIPSRRGKGGMNLPLGFLYVGGIIERSGHSVEILDPYRYDPNLISFDKADYSEIEKKINDYCPKIIGFGGIASSYGRTKKISEYLYQKYPDIIQIAGGPLASVFELILTKTRINLVFHGETEITLPEFLEKFEKNENWRTISGISYFEGNTVLRNPMAPQIENLDLIPYPAYHLVNVEEYLTHVSGTFEAFREDSGENFDANAILQKIGKGGKLFPVMTARGCTHKCSFCYRHMKGYRQHSVPYVINHIKHLMSHYAIRGFDISDELFNFKKEWIMEFCNALEQEKLDIYYRISGARVDRIDREILQRLKETGCFYISYGEESGSDIILKEYRKGVSAQQNKDIPLLTKEVGLINPMEILIGSPGETQKTIKETIQLLIDNSAVNPSINYLIPFPETPIWQYAMDNRLIPDIEKFLDEVAERGGAPIVNLTHVPDRVWLSWYSQITNELKLNRYRHKGMMVHYFILYPFIKIFNLMNPYIPRKFIASLKGR